VRSLVLAILVVATAATFAAGSGVARASTDARATLTVRSSPYGSILFDGRGRALYAFTRDRRGGTSRCYGACAQKWPVYYAGGRLVAGKGVKRSLIGTVRRRDGRRQITYNGRPLYYYVGDKSPGRVTCQNVPEFGGTWLVMRPSGTLVR
jgi:predicted lipoprotein with Yx(FWY)xxD motif